MPRFTLGIGQVLANVCAKWWLQRFHRVLWSLPLTAGLMIVAAALLLRSDAEDPQANFARSRAASLALARPPLSNEQNANADYKLARLAYVPFTGPGDDNPYWRTYDESKYFDDPAVLALWSSNARAIALLQPGTQKECCDLGIDYSQIPWTLPPLLPWRENANLLALDARCRARKGDHPGAAKSLLAIHRMAHHLDSAPTPSLITTMIAVAMDDIADQALEAILIWDAPSKAGDLSAYRAIGHPENPYLRYARSLETEKISTLLLMDSIATGNWSPPANQSWQRWPKAELLSPLTYGSDRKCFEAVANALIESLRKGRQPDDVRDLIDRFQTGPAPVTCMYFPSIRRCSMPLVDVYERGIVDDVALAFLQFRNKHRHDPATLVELVPEFLPAIPVGAVNSEPIHMRKDVLGAKDAGKWSLESFPDGQPAIRIYAAGPNGKDDGGFNDYNNRDDTIVILPVRTTPIREQE